MSLGNPNLGTGPEKDENQFDTIERLETNLIQMAKD